MATLKEITAKCKAGEIDEAYEIAIQDWQNSPDDVWAQRGVGWVLYYYIKADVENKKKGAFFEHLDKLFELTKLDSFQDRLIFENVLWKIAEYAKGIQVNDFALLSELFAKIQGHQFIRSKPYSLLLQYFLKFEGWNKMVDFIEWWELSNLQLEDYKQFPSSNGKKVMSLAERVYIAYSKALIKLGDKERIAAFIPKLESLMKKYPDMLYPGYFCGKLLIALGAEREQILKKVVPFVRKKVNEFWAWQLMSEIFYDDTKKQIACLLRALQCKTQESFLGKIRIKLVGLYINSNDYSRAKFHIEKVSTCYTQQGWKLPEPILHWSAENWFQTAQPDPSEPLDYKPITEEMLLFVLMECNAIVTHVNVEKKMATVIYGVKKEGFFNYDKYVKKLKVGDCINMAILEVSANGFMKLKSVKKNDRLIESNYCKKISGVVVSNEYETALFIEINDGNSYYIPDYLVNKNDIEEKDRVTGVVIYSYNRKLKEWKWKCLSVNKEKKQNVKSSNLEDYISIDNDNKDCEACNLYNDEICSGLGDCPL